ncbi:hydantoinase B/oxoprolinase family protein [Ensifer soli]|uniref:hydantoinase B/oxoprolinase family protein n=1 Tax=Ciceribacter sp. sgz301302 TaxID=3342379 RepID=UPI0035B80CD6
MTEENHRDAAPATIEPHMLSVLSSRLSAIVREMNATLMKSSRSSVIKNSRDFSCGLLTFDHRLLSVEDCIPIHIAALELATKPITEFFDDIRPGDAFMNNCPYTGNSHHADMTLCVPVFVGDQPMFWTLARAHHADIGAPIPSTYLPEAKTIYEEGVHLPCVQIQQDFRDRADIIRMCRTKIRVADLWYGDYLAQVGACRVGERRLNELADRYGLDVIRAFIREWMAYGERRMDAEIRKLPKGTWSFSTRHDPVPGIADDGIPVNVTVEIRPEDGEIIVDATDNIDCIAGGLNLTECTATAACRIGVFYNLDPTLPHNEGSASRIKIRLRENCALGIPRYPVGTSVATTNLSSRLITAVAACFAELGEPHGMAEMAYSQALGEAVISGNDATRDDLPYVNQIFVGYGGGGAIHGHDGWLASGAACDGGQMALDSIEINEAMYPILIESRGCAVDSGGPGEWEGAPGIEGVYRPLAGRMTAFWGSDGDVTPARGVRGGGDAATSGNWLRRSDGTIRTLPAFGDVTIGADEAIAFRACGGGGYGDPRKRDVARVLRSVRRGWITPERARDVYGVAIVPATDGLGVEIDEDGTRALRAGETA